MDDGRPIAVSSRFDRGLRTLQRVAGVERPAVVDSFGDIAPDIARFVVEFAYGDVISRSGLALRERQLCTVAALAAAGNAEPQLQFHVRGALNVGASRRQVVETLIQTCVHAGFPATINAMVAVREILLGHPGSEGDRPAAAPADGPGDRYERGMSVLGTLGGGAAVSVVGGLEAVAPDLGRYVVEFCFGDVHARGGLDRRTRGLAAVAACVARGMAKPQLERQVHALLNVGGDEGEIVEMMMQMALYAGFPAALNAIAAARDVFDERRREPLHDVDDVANLWRSWSPVRERSPIASAP